MQQNIYILSRVFYPDFKGGAEKQCFFLAKGLAQKGFSVTVLTRRKSSIFPRAEQKDGFTIIRFPVLTVHFGKYFRQPAAALILSIQFFFYLLKRKKQIDIIQTFFPTYELLCAILVKQFKPTIRVFGRETNSGALSNYLSSGMIIRFCLNRIFARVERIIFNSKVCQLPYLQYSTLQKRQMQIIANGVLLPKRFKKNYKIGATVRLLTVGRLAPEKNIELLLKVLAKLRQNREFCTLTIVTGNCPPKQLNRYQQIIKQLALEEQVTFLFDRTNLEETYLKHDIFLLLSKAEGSSNALLEAMSFGLPCLTTPAGDGKDLMLNGAGLITDYAVQNIVRQVTKYIASEQLRISCGKKARQKIGKSYTTENNLQKYLKLYQVAA